MPRKARLVQMTTTIDEPLLDRLYRVAVKTNISVAALTREGIDLMLQQTEPALVEVTPGHFIVDPNK
jgi:hypothetical protein